MQFFNASAIWNVFRLTYNPALCLPHLTVESFDKLPIPLVFPGSSVRIRGIVLDKDNCFAKDLDDKIWPAYGATWKKLCAEYGPQHILIVSNSAGTNDDIDYAQAQKLERDLGIAVLRHPTKKPGCSAEIMAYFAHRGITRPEEIVVAGDRLLTDILMANMMGSWSVWLSEGAELSHKLFPRLERYAYDKLVTSREVPFVPPTPQLTQELPSKF